MYYINVKGGGHNCSGFKNVLGVLTTEEKLHRMNRVFRANIIELPKIKKNVIVKFRFFETMRILYRLVLKIDYEWKDFGIKLMKCTLKSGVQVSIQSEKRSMFY